MTISGVLSRCLQHWRGAGIRLGAPVPETEIREAWCRLGKRVSRDVIELYTTLGGFAEYEWDNDDNLWSLWPWDYVIEQNTLYPSDGVRFACVSIQVHSYELMFENDNDSVVCAVWDHKGAPLESWQVVSLTEFFRIYLDDPKRLW